ncbi:Ger(x)C family spore germination protein [Paenibacillus humicola]|uniref:Ger(x)C family spore germination protein n=1 Tax=Paenibacillus humicola TaxID=3110540 RepID=UPI00237A28FF|nr:Ger(x)C family spore germination protein [Paenibacillus humicola]
MRKIAIRCLLLIVLILIPTGCWSKHELKEVGFILGWGMDLEEAGKYKGTAQIALPSALAVSQSGGGQAGRRYVTLSASGKSILDVAGGIQQKTSRFLFAGHRQNIFLGERLARHGLAHIIDEYSRNPNVRLRTEIFVVKGGTASEMLDANRPFERVPVMGFNKLYATIGGKALNSFLELLVDSSDPSSCPVIPAFKIEPVEGDHPAIKYAGSGVFTKDLRLVGYLNEAESLLRLWMLNQHFRTFAYTLPADESKQPISVEIEHLKGTIRSSAVNGKPSFRIELGGKGFLRENETDVNLSKPHRIEDFERQLNAALETEVMKMVRRTQTVYKTDIFHFGQKLHRQHPFVWKKMKNNWEEKFPEANVTIVSRVVISRVGLTGTPAHLPQGGGMP